MRRILPLIGEIVHTYAHLQYHPEYSGLAVTVAKFQGQNTMTKKILADDKTIYKLIKKRFCPMTKKYFWLITIIFFG